MDPKLPTTPASAPTAARPLRQPTRTRLTGLILLAFMLVVFFVGPAELPVFFQRLVGIVNALLAMLTVVFAIREYGKKYNRLRWPLVGRVSTSKVAGSLTFVAVFGWWLSPWAPIPAGEAEPDLWRLLEHGLDEPMLTLADRQLATIAAPMPSAAARHAAKGISTESSPFPQALRAVAEARFDDANILLTKLEQDRATGRDMRETIRAARAQADLYAGRFAEASGHFGELLGDEPRREDYLAHGALAAALAGDYATAAGRARQLLDQAAARGHESPRYRQAVNLLVAIRVMQGTYAEAARLGDETKSSRQRASSDDNRGQIDPLLAADANNQAVLRVLTSPATSDPTPAGEGLSAGFVLAKKLWIEWNVANGRPRELADLNVAAELYSLGIVALGEERFDQAGELLDQALSLQRAASGRATNPAIGVSLNALAELRRIEADFAQAQSLASEAADVLDSSQRENAPERLASLATRAALDADLGHYDRAIARYQQAIESAAKSLAPKHPYLAALRIRHAETCLLSGKNREGETAIGEALAILDQAGLEQVADRAQAMRILGVAYLRQSKRELAQRQFDASAKIVGLPAAPAGGESNDQHIPETLEVAALRAARAELAADPQTYPSAADDCEAAIAIVQTKFGDRAANHPLLAEYVRDLARVRVREGKPLAAEPLFRQSLAIDERALPADHPAILAALDDLATVLDETAQADEAKRLADRAKQLRAGRGEAPDR
ncbi:MAG TPA: tetratricopeptide repeat protein [Pirellulales bacterium]|nr:tetratricopeptide repeat protein [Pirellulales bacterium]